MSRALAVAVFEVVFVAVALVWRTVQQRRRTGSSGFVAFKERGAAARLAALSMVAGVVGLVAGPTVAAGESRGWGVVAALGIVLMVGGLGLTLAAQQQMGRSWRIGVDPDERTELVTRGLFGWVRNPIFTAMIAFGAGVALAVPNVWSVSGALLLAAGIVAQVLLVEEPYLRAVHEQAYEQYLRCTGRFLPRLGRGGGEGTEATGPARQSVKGV